LFVESIALERVLPCLAEPGKVIVVGRPARPLDEALPYLAALPGVIGFNPLARTLTFRRPAGFVTLHADRVYITQVKDGEEGLRLLEALCEAINATWARRAELEPVSESRRAPRPLDVYSLLPQTNCRACGEATCMAFAFGLLQGRHAVGECPGLREDPALLDRQAALAGML
jgi:ArsR family metal-binding transcriptional regulator